jgi:tetratricopeptide (TPR) repeat protein
MSTKSPPTRRKFQGDWDEIKYLYLKLLYWWYERDDRTRALRFGKRLKKLLRKADPKQETLFGAEGLSLFWEVRGDLAKAIYHRRREIERTEWLHQYVADNPDHAFVLEGYGISHWSDSLVLLAILYHDSGDLDRALQTLEESKKLCKTHGIEFDGQDLLDDYLAEKKSLNGRRR